MASTTCYCYEFTASCDSTVEYVDCDGNLQTESIITGNLYRICSQILPTTGCLTGVITNIGQCVNGDCPVSPVVCICNKVTNTTNETQTYCYIDCDSNQQSITLQPGQASDKICVSAWTECIICDCLESTFGDSISNVEYQFKIEKTNQIKNGKPVYYSYIIYNNDYSEYGRYTLTFESDNCWYGIPDSNLYEFTGPSFRLCENIDCPIGVWEKIECSCLESTFVTPDFSFGLSLFISRIDENGHAVFETKVFNTNYNIIYNILLGRWEFIETSSETLIAYYVTDSQCPYTGIFSPVTWTTIDLNNSFSLDGFGDCFDEFSTIKCKPKCDCINIILTSNPYGPPINFATLLIPTGNVVNSKPEYILVFISNTGFATVNWNSVTNCWEIIDDTLTILATLCDSSDPNCPIGIWVSNTIDLISVTSDYCIDTILPENIENFGDCIDGQCPTIPVTTTTTLQPAPIQPTNECDVITIFPMNVICESTNPTFTNTFDGTASILITGGTPPYEILWDNGGVGSFVANLGVGEYVATISDYYNDFIITSTCVLTAQTPATTTTTSTTTLPQFGNLCFVISGYFGGAYQSQYINFDFDGYINDNPSWLSDDGEYFIYWNTGSTSQWTVSGYTTGAIFNQNPNTPPITGWQYFGKQNLGISAYEGNCNVVNPITFQIGKNNATCVNDGSIIVNASGGVPPYEYSINGGTSFVTTPIINNLTSGSYVVLVKDSLNNVSTTQNVLISQTITNTTYTLTLNKTGNNINIVVSPTLPIGTSISFDVVYESVFTVAPSPTSASFNGNLNLLLNGSPITPNSPIITNTTTFNPCNNGSFYTTNNKLIWSNVTMTNTTTLTGLLTGQVTPNTPLPTCYSTNKNVSVTLNNATISGCQCCSVVVTQSTGRDLISL